MDGCVMGLFSRHTSNVSGNDPEPKKGQQLMSSDEILNVMSGEDAEKKQAEPRHAKPKK